MHHDRREIQRSLPIQTGLFAGSRIPHPDVDCWIAMFRLVLRRDSASDLQVYAHQSRVG